nr:hypothetical protein [Tanacetum cinerariifolium]
MESYSECSQHDEFKWQVVDRTSRPIRMYKLIYTRFTKLIIDHFLSNNISIPRRYDAELHSEGQDSPLTKIIDTIDGNQEVNVPSKPKKAVVPKKPKTIIVADNIVEQEVAVKLAKSMSVEEQRLQQHDIMTQLTIGKQVEKDIKMHMLLRRD